jgi:hypothetical protein
VIELKDDAAYLEYFAAKRPIRHFMTDEDVWGEDLTKYENFYDTVIKNIEKIKNGACLL